MNKKNLLLILPLFLLTGCESNPVIPATPVLKQQSKVTSKPINSFKTENKKLITPDFSQNMENMVNYEQKEKGIYKITTNDIYLMSNYSKIVSYNVIASNKKGKSDLYVPYYKKLKIIRSGKISLIKNWKIKVEEMNSGTFTIEGSNSKGEGLNQECTTLVECFTLI